MVQYFEENSKVKDQVRANSGQRGAIMNREGKFFNREVCICSPSQDNELILSKHLGCESIQIWDCIIWCSREL